MKRLVFYVSIIFLGSLFLRSCQKVDSWAFDYPKEVLCGGVWCSDAVKSQGKWIDVTGAAFKDLQFTISFSTDGTYTGTGYFGTGKGTYEAIGNVIKTYIDGELFYTYTVHSMNADVAELTMKGSGTSSLELRVKKI